MPLAAALACLVAALFFEQLARSTTTIPKIAEQQNDGNKEMPVTSPDTDVLLNSSLFQRNVPELQVLQRINALCRHDPQRSNQAGVARRHCCQRKAVTLPLALKHKGLAKAEAATLADDKGLSRCFMHAVLTS
jgi:hypothetical protein